MDLTDQLSPLERLALAYAPAKARPAWTGLLLFEHRLADTARPGRDPLMIQLRLAWWRDRMAQPAHEWPAGEPLLRVLAAWDTQRAALTGLIDGYEARHVGEDGGVELDAARIEAFAALGVLVGAERPEAIRRAAADYVAPGKAGSAPALPRAMRPLAILRGMAVRDAAGKGGTGWRDFAAAMRLGLIGR